MEGSLRILTLGYRFDPGCTLGIFPPEIVEKILKPIYVLDCTLKKGRCNALTKKGKSCTNLPSEKGLYADCFCKRKDHQRQAPDGIYYHTLTLYLEAKERKEVSWHSKLPHQSPPLIKLGHSPDYSFLSVKYQRKKVFSSGHTIHLNRKIWHYTPLGYTRHFDNEYCLESIDDFRLLIEKNHKHYFIDLAEKRGSFNQIFSSNLPHRLSIEFMKLCFPHRKHVRSALTNKVLSKIPTSRGIFLKALKMLFNEIRGEIEPEILEGMLSEAVIREDIEALEFLKENKVFESVLPGEIRLFSIITGFPDVGIQWLIENTNIIVPEQLLRTLWRFPNKLYICGKDTQYMELETYLKNKVGSMSEFKITCTKKEYKKASTREEKIRFIRKWFYQPEGYFSRRLLYHQPWFYENERKLLSLWPSHQSIETISDKAVDMIFKSFETHMKKGDGPHREYLCYSSSFESCYYSADDSDSDYISDDDDFFE